MSEKLALYGFNNLTKSLSFNIYDVCYAKSQREQKDYIAYIDQQYNSERLTKLLVDVTNMIGASVLNISSQDYEPQGSSVTILIADESKIPVGDTTVAHLDKSHITVHTYPEYHPDTCLATFRVDIDVATCGEITPLCCHSPMSSRLKLSWSRSTRSRKRSTISLSFSDRKSVV